MLQTISWSLFFIVTAVALIIYYVIAGLFFFRHELLSIFKQNPLHHSNRDEPTDQPASSNNLLGKIKHVDQSVPREEKVNAEELIISPLQYAEQAVAQSTSEDEVLVNSIADLLEKIKTLTETFSGTSQEELLPLLKGLLSRYKQLIGSPYQDAVNLFIYNSCKEQFDFNEINSWWPSIENQNNNNINNQ